jgi:hypothetical protein
VAPPKGNQFWKARSSHGRDKIFASSDALWDAACEYFQWVEDNPLTEYKVAQFQGAPVSMELPKMRAMTIAGLCTFIDIDETTWRDWRKSDDFSTVIARVERIMYTQKFTGAAADLLNANIISRELGLADKQDLNHSGRIDSNQNIKQITADMSADEATRIYQDMLNGID